ncbi:MAG: phosphotransferase [Thermomicrobiales bacterium]
MSAEEIPFADGNVTGAVRVGATVRRAAGPWTPVIHALLRYLERVGFEAAPRILGIDERGREILTYIAGETNPDPLVSFGTDAALAEIARLLRRYHDSVAGFTPPAAAAWRFGVGAPTSGDVICHNDVAPWNTIVANGQPVAFIDWDVAAPAPRAWDIAYALWRFAPLYDDAACSTPIKQGCRMRVFCDAYGLVDRSELLDTIEQRQRALHDSIVQWATAGEPAFSAMLRDRHAAGIVRDIAYLHRHRTTFAGKLA